MSHLDTRMFLEKSNQTKIRFHQRLHAIRRCWRAAGAVDRRFCMRMHRRSLAAATAVVSARAVQELQAVRIFTFWGSEGAKSSFIRFPPRSKFINSKLQCIDIDEYKWVCLMIVRSQNSICLLRKTSVSKALWSIFLDSLQCVCCIYIIIIFCKFYRYISTYF